MFDEKEADNVVGFFRDSLQFIEGDRARNNEPFNLEDWQKCIVGNLFGWKRPDGTRRYRTSLVFVPRKNGKTPLAAGIIDYVGFCDGEPGAQIYSAAAERDQAALIFRHAAGMINTNPVLKENSQIYKTYKSIEFHPCNGTFKALSAEADSKHGLNAHLVVVDELHVQPNRDLVDTLATSTASRSQPLLLYITTAGFDRHSICWETYEYACKVRDGLVEDKSFFPVIYEIGKDDDWKDEEVWRKANPNLGISVSLEYLRANCRKAQELPSLENSFRRLHLNQWTQQDVRWMNMDIWRECGEIPVEDLEGRECYGGLDLSSTTDLSAFVLVFPDEDGVDVLPFCWIPRDNARKRSDTDRVPYLDWYNQGLIQVTDGNIIDYDVIRRRVNELGKKYNIREIGIDRWNATHLSTQLDGDGFTIVPFGQGFKSMSAPTKYLESLVLRRKINHGNHPILNWCMSNVSIETDAAENIKPSKKKSTERIDLVVAMIEAIGCMMVRQEKKESVYEKRGLVVL